jgi:DNA-binding transcriptional LysR family regulator
MTKKEISENQKCLKDLRIADLELFISAARLKNLGKAASFHHISQSAASSAIQRVEIAFGTPLSTHEKRQFRLTYEGLTLLPRAENWIRQLREVVANNETRPIRLATTHAIARVCLPPVLPGESIQIHLMRPDLAYASVLRDEVDIAIVLDNAAWEGVIASEIGKGTFQLYASQKDLPQSSVLLPEDQMEVLALQQRWRQIYGQPILVKARIPSWSLIADICANSKEIGFLPDFLAAPYHLYSMPWQPASSRYRILALYKNTSKPFQHRLEKLLVVWKNALTNI